jgi:hypothetical protein
MAETIKELLQIYIAAFSIGDFDAIERCFHKDATIVGKQDGVFIATDRSTFLLFLKNLGLGKAGPELCQVEPIWEDRQGNLAVACIVEKVRDSKVLCYQTLIKTHEGWKFLSRSFLGYDDELSSTSMPWRRVNRQ